jgi:hypothetical protein
MSDKTPDAGKVVERLNPLNDFMFVAMMGEPGDEDQLLAFLNAVLKRTRKDPLVSVEIIENRTITAEILGDKTSILDVRAKAWDGTRVNIEVQLKNLGNMDRRSLFYWSRDYTRNIEAGDDYVKLPNVIAINIVNKEALRAYQMREMALSDWTSSINHAKREGKAEGMLEIARSMKADKAPLEKIVLYTKLTPEEIERA